MPNYSQEPPASSKAQSQEFRDMEVLVTFKIQIEKQNSEHGYSKDQCQYPYQDQDAKTQSGTSSSLQPPNEDLKDIDVLCTFKIKIENQNLNQGYIKDP